MKSIPLKTRQKSEMINITPHIEQYLEENKFEDGLCTVFCPHTTAGITINENADPDVKRDFLHYLEKLIPGNYQGFHHSEGNSDGHLKASLTGSSVTLLIENGRPVLGTWQGIYFCEYDGPRQREFYIKTIPS